jgi:hypothetical protein
VSLRDLQRDFCGFLCSDGRLELNSVAPQAKRGLGVYHYAHRATLLAALSDVFERTHGWLGDQRFDSACRAHIADNPPHSWTLADYGFGFERTLARLYPENPEVEELAWLDWSLRAAFNGPDSGSLDPAALAGIDWETAVLVLAPTLVWHRVRTNAPALWHALEEADNDPPAAERLTVQTHLTVWRQGLMPRFQTVSDTEFMALQLAATGASFGAICEHLAAHSSSGDDAAMLAGAMLQRWISEGVVIDLR